MGYKTDNIVRDLSKIIINPNKRKTSPYDSSATVTRVENDIMYVRMPGSTEEMPVKRTVNGKVGDVVQVRVSGHTGFVVGNATNPPTDDSTAIAANRVATNALAKSVEAIEANLVTAKQLQADEARITSLQAEKASVEELTAARARIDDLETNSLTAESAIIKSLQTDKADVTALNASNARIGTLESTALTADSAVIKSLQTDKANVSDLTAATARITTLEGDHVKVSDLTAANAKITNLETNKADIDLANVNNAWIENGVVKDAVISDAQIIGVSANKLTAGTIDASSITVTNLNADNITTGTINGQRIGAGSLSLDKLSEDVYTETEVDNKLKTMQDEIDGAIETWTGTVVPTLNNEPASKWQNDAAKDKHVGDVYYVVNAGNQADGYCYRFTKSGTTYSWTLIKDSDVTAALQRLVDAEGDIDGLQTFQSTTSSWMTNTDTELSSLKTRTSTVETNLGNKVETSTFNNLSQTVDDNTASITSLTNTVNTKADGSTVETLSNTVNTVSQKANSNESKISNLTTTVNGIDTRVSTAESSITQQATEIESKVSKDGVISTINQSAESVTIDAQKVNIAGAAIFGDYSTTTQMNAAIAAAKADAEKTATNYITYVDSANGIRVYDGQASNKNVNFSQINADGMQIYQGGDTSANCVAFFGDNSQIGRSDNSHISMGFNNFLLVDKNGNKYVELKDSRNEQGIADIVDRYVANGINDEFKLSLTATSADYSVSVSGDETGATYQKTTTKVTFSEPPTKNAVITISYQTVSNFAKAFSFGTRRYQSTVGGLSFATGYISEASGYCSFSEGVRTTASGYASHAEGNYTVASGDYSHAEGHGADDSLNEASGFGSHAEGTETKARGIGSHAEGTGRAYGDWSHAEGAGKAYGQQSHAEGSFTVASGDYSHAGGMGTTANGYASVAIGRYNEPDTATSPQTASNWAFMIGNGSSGHPSNALTVTWGGNETISGTLTQSSDRRLKDHIDYLDEDAVEFVRGLKPAHYIKDNEHHVGFYAQDVEEVDKWNCMTGEMNGYMTLGYTEIIAPLVRYCQSLEARIAELEKRR